MIGNPLCFSLKPDVSNRTESLSIYESNPTKDGLPDGPFRVVRTVAAWPGENLQVKLFYDAKFL